MDKLAKENLLNLKKGVADYHAFLFSKKLDKRMRQELQMATSVIAMLVSAVALDKMAEALKSKKGEKMKVASILDGIVEK